MLLLKSLLWSSLFLFVGMVKKRTAASKGKPCLGELSTGAACKRSRDGTGKAVVMNKVCVHCKEQRCRAHCRCARSGSPNAKGRAAARGKDQAKKPKVTVAAATRTTSAVAAPLSLPGPVGREPGPSCLLLDVGTFYERCCSDLATASEVEMATYQYDCPSLQKVLLKRLKGRSPFSLKVYLDAEMFGAATPRYQKSRVKELWQAGAQVFLCKGPGPQGSFHAKAVVVDRRYLYTGSPNFTYKSHNNEELCWRMTGPVVGQVLQKLVLHSQKRKPWDGT